MMKKVSETFCKSEKFRTFAVLKLGSIQPNQLILNNLGKIDNNYKQKVIKQCYSQRKQNSEGSRKAA